MKLVLLLPPVVSAVVVATWLAEDRRTAIILEDQNAVLRQRLVAHTSDTASPTIPATSLNLPDPPSSVDWKDFAGQVLTFRSGGMGDMRTMIRVQHHIGSMDRDELATALDEIGTLDLPPRSKVELEQLLIKPLCQKDTEFALNRYLDRANDNTSGVGRLLASALNQWALQDPTRATAWLDQQIADGKLESTSLDGKYRPRIMFEGSLIASMVPANLTAAGDRLDSLPTDQRRQVLSEYATRSLKEEDQAAFATLVRTNLDQKEQTSTLASLASNLQWGAGFDKADAFLDRIQATPAERAATVDQMALRKVTRFSQTRKITCEDMDALREWAVTQAPEGVGAMTGKAISYAIRQTKGLEFSEAAAMAVRFHESTGDDNILEGFFENDHTITHTKEARAIAEKLNDPALREKYMKKFEDTY